MSEISGKIVDTLKQYARSRAFIFLIKGLGLYLLWIILYNVFWIGDSAVNNILTDWATVIPVKMLTFFSGNFHMDIQGSKNWIILNNHPLLGIHHNCNGLALYALFTGFVIAFPGRIKDKLWFIPVGLLIVFFVNSVRVIALIIVQVKWPSALEFSHKYTFTFLVYLFVFFLWWIWVNKLSHITSQK